MHKGLKLHSPTESAVIFLQDGVLASPNQLKSVISALHMCQQLHKGLMRDSHQKAQGKQLTCQHSGVLRAVGNSTYSSGSPCSAALPSQLSCSNMFKAAGLQNSHVSFSGFCIARMFHVSYLSEPSEPVLICYFVPHDTSSYS